MTRRRKPGPEGHLPTPKTRQQVETLAGLGIRRQDIATVMCISENTLRRHYRTELVRGSVKANAKVSESLFKRATGNSNGAVTAQIFWMKCRAGWRDVNPDSLDHRRRRRT